MPIGESRFLGAALSLALFLGGIWAAGPAFAAAGAPACVDREGLEPGREAGAGFSGETQGGLLGGAYACSYAAGIEAPPGAGDSGQAFLAAGPLPPAFSFRDGATGKVDRTISGSADVELPDEQNTITIDGFYSGALTGGNLTDDVTVNSNVSGNIDLGDGNDILTLREGWTITPGDANALPIRLGAGNDRLTLEARSSVNRGIDLGGGDNVVNGDGAFTDTMTMGGGDDTIDLPNAVVAKAVELGGGKNELTVLRMAGDGAITAGGGKDTVEFSSFVTAGGDIELGGGENSLTLAAPSGDSDPVQIWSGEYGRGSAAEGKDVIAINSSKIRVEGALSMGNGENALSGTGEVRGTVTMGDGPDTIGVDPSIDKEKAGRSNRLVLAAVTLGTGDSTEGDNKMWALSAGRITGGAKKDKVTLTHIRSGRENIDLGDGENELTLRASGPVDWSGGYGTCALRGSGVFCTAGSEGKDTVEIGKGVTVSGVLHFGAGDNVLKGSVDDDLRVGEDEGLGESMDGSGTVAGETIMGDGNDTIGDGDLSTRSECGDGSTASVDCLAFAGRVSLGGGNNTMEAGSAGQITAGVGNDTIALAGDATGIVTLEERKPDETGPAGENSFSARNAMGIRGGEGPDTITLAGDARGEINLGGGDGANTLAVGGRLLGDVTGGSTGAGKDMVTIARGTGDIDLAGGENELVVTAGAAGTWSGIYGGACAQPGAQCLATGKDVVTVGAGMIASSILYLGEGENEIKGGGTVGGAVMGDGNDTIGGPNTSHDDSKLSFSGLVALGGGENTMRAIRAGGITAGGGKDTVDLAGGITGEVRLGDGENSLKAASSHAIWGGNDDDTITVGGRIAGDLSLGNGENIVTTLSARNITGGDNEVDGDGVVTKANRDMVTLSDMEAGGWAIDLKGGENTLRLRSNNPVDWSGSYGSCPISGTGTCGGENADTVVFESGVSMSGPLRMGDGDNALRGSGTISGVVTMGVGNDIVGLDPAGPDGVLENTGNNPTAEQDNPTQPQVDAANALNLAGGIDLGRGENKMWAASAGAVFGGAGADTVIVAGDIFREADLGGGANVLRARRAGAVMGGSGSDTVALSDIASWKGGIHLGDGANELTLMASSPADWSGSYGVCGEGAASSCVDGGAGPDTIVIGEGITLSGTLDFGDGNNSVRGPGTISGRISMGSGNDTIGDGDHSDQASNPDMTLAAPVDLGNGDNSLKAVSAVAIRGGIGSDTVLVTGDVEGSVDLGDGVNFLDADNVFSVKAGAGDDTVLLRGSVGAGIELGQGGNILTVHGTVGGDITSSGSGSGLDEDGDGVAERGDMFLLNGALRAADIDMGGGQNMLTVNSGWTGSYSGGGGSDTVILRAARDVHLSSVDPGKGVNAFYVSGARGAPAGEATVTLALAKREEADDSLWICNEDFNVGDVGEAKDGCDDVEADTNANDLHDDYAYSIEIDARRDYGKWGKIIIGNKQSVHQSRIMLRGSLELFDPEFRNLRLLADGKPGDSIEVVGDGPQGGGYFIDEITKATDPATGQISVTGGTLFELDINLSETSASDMLKFNQTATLGSNSHRVLTVDLKVAEGFTAPGKGAKLDIAQVPVDSQIETLNILRLDGAGDVAVGSEIILGGGVWGLREDRASGFRVFSLKLLENDTTINEAYGRSTDLDFGQTENAKGTQNLAIRHSDWAGTLVSSVALINNITILDGSRASGDWNLSAGKTTIAGSGEVLGKVTLGDGDDVVGGFDGTAGDAARSRLALGDFLLGGGRNRVKALRAGSVASGDGDDEVILLEAGGGAAGNFNLGGGMNMLSVHALSAAEWTGTYGECSDPSAGAVACGGSGAGSDVIMIGSGVTASSPLALGGGADVLKGSGTVGVTAFGAPPGSLGSLRRNVSLGAGDDAIGIDPAGPDGLLLNTAKNPAAEQDNPTRAQLEAANMLTLVSKATVLIESGGAVVSRTPGVDADFAEEGSKVVARAGGFYLPGSHERCRDVPNPNGGANRACKVIPMDPRDPSGSDSSVYPGLIAEVRTAIAKAPGVALPRDVCQQITDRNIQEDCKVVARAPGFYLMEERLVPASSGVAEECQLVTRDLSTGIFSEESCAVMDKVSGVDLGEGDNMVIAKALGHASPDGSLHGDLAAGAGDDTVELAEAAYGRIDLGGGANHVTVGGQWIGSYSGGAGPDTIVLKSGFASPLALEEGHDMLRPDPGAGENTMYIVGNPGGAAARAIVSLSSASGAGSSNSLYLCNEAAGDGACAWEAGEDYAFNVELSTICQPGLYDAAPGNSCGNWQTVRIENQPSVVQSQLAVTGQVTLVDSDLSSLRIVGNGAVARKQEGTGYIAYKNPMGNIVWGNPDDFSREGDRVAVAGGEILLDTITVSGTYGALAQMEAAGGIQGTVFELDVDFSEGLSDMLVFDASSRKSSASRGFSNVLNVSVARVEESKSPPPSGIRRIEIARVHKGSDVGGIEFAGSSENSITIDIEEVINGQTTFGRQRWTLRKDTDDQGEYSTYYLALTPEFAPPEPAPVDPGDAPSRGLTPEEAQALALAQTKMAGQHVISAAVSGVEASFKVPSGFSSALNRAGAAQDRQVTIGSSVWTKLSVGQETHELTEDLSKYKQSVRMMTAGIDAFAIQTAIGRVTHSLVTQHGIVKTDGDLETNMTSYGYGMEVRQLNQSFFSLSAISSQMRVTTVESRESREFYVSGTIISAEAGWDIDLTESMTLHHVGGLTHRNFGDVDSLNGTVLKGFESLSGKLGLGFNYAESEDAAPGFAGQSLGNIYGNLLVTHDFDAGFDVAEPGKAPVSISTDKSWIDLSLGWVWNFEQSSLSAELSGAQTINSEAKGKRVGFSLAYDLKW